MTSTFILDNPKLPTAIQAWDDRKRRLVSKRVNRARLEQAADDLDAAAKLLRTEKWTTGSWCDTRGRMCAQGAIAKVANGDPHATGSDLRTIIAIEVADAAVFVGESRDDKEGVSDIMSFNDSLRFITLDQKKKHAAMVRKALRTAAAAARAKAATLKR